MVITSSNERPASGRCRRLEIETWRARLQPEMLGLVCWLSTTCSCYWYWFVLVRRNGEWKWKRSILLGVMVVKNYLTIVGLCPISVRTQQQVVKSPVAVYIAGCGCEMFKLSTKIGHTHTLCTLREVSLLKIVVLFCGILGAEYPHLWTMDIHKWSQTFVPKVCYKNQRETWEIGLVSRHMGLLSELLGEKLQGVPGGFRLLRVTIMTWRTPRFIITHYISRSSLRHPLFRLPHQKIDCSQASLRVHYIAPFRLGFSRQSSLRRYRVHVEHGFGPRRFDTVAKSAPAQKWGSIPAGQNDDSDENRKGTGFRLQKSVSSCRILSAPRITSRHIQHFDRFDQNRLAQ